ncbi:hypothetical protein EJ08DRAFT_234591 [Tothia fuscella]|uniref:Zn(2)-C6 fungal-type domain-containing protein n=1 Tax=Tothia fuscella TaxID=1048955 RepID=A0A9P4P320_9PEZI|nr:hypothetical protein EJ08DRAFT_234591 [Tothia fuscella]
MEADPDAKRARRDHEHPAYPHSAPPLRPATAPVPAHVPAPHQYSEPPPSAPPSAPPSHSYQPPTSRPPSAHHPTASGVPIYRRDSDPRSHTQHPPPTSQHGYHEHRPSYGSVNQSHPRSYPEQSPPRHTGATGLSGPSLQVQDSKLSQDMHDPGHPPPGYGPPLMEHHPNGGPSNGLPYLPQHDPYAVGSHPPGYPPPAPATAGAGAYAQGGAYHAGGPTNYGTVTRRKQVRATQACNNCRQRKQKCDEAKPCSYCQNESLKCEYREVPPPKTDRSITQILESTKGTEDRVAQFEDRLAQLGDTVERMGDTVERMGGTLEQMGGMMEKILNVVTSPNHDATSPESGGQVYHQSEYHASHAVKSSDFRLAGPSQQSVRAIKQETEPQLQVVDPGLQEHETGAHYLMGWPVIKDFFANAGITKREYVQEEDEKQGTLRPYGASELPRSLEDHNSNHVTSPSWSAQSDPASANSPTDGLNGVEFGPSADYNRENIGGLNPDGSLKLDRETVQRLYASYMKHMWVMHPFLDVSWLQRKLHKFMPPPGPVGRSPNFAMPGAPASYHGLPTKRKRPSEPSDHLSDPATPETAQWERSPQKPERSMTNAIILLVLALGKVLESDKFLLRDERLAAQGQQATDYQPSPGAVRPSPPHFSNQYPNYSRSNVPSPSYEQARSQAGSRGSSNDYAPNDTSRSIPPVLVRNADRYPGLAYFAYATDILGNNFGGNDIIHAQAFLLAGLYFGQLGRALESWSWITSGCRATMMLRAKKQVELDNPTTNESGRGVPYIGQDTDDDVALISILCWSALQLESDLRAELDRLPKTGDLMYSESKTRLPLRVVGVPDVHGQFIRLPDESLINSTNVMYSYTTQIYLRLALNRVHLSLYAPVSNDKNTTAKRHLAWADVDADSHWRNLADHRGLINKHPDYRWRDSDPPSNDMLTARIRAKYYGAAYIILRPYLYLALKWDQGDGLENFKNYADEWNKKQQGEENDQLYLPDRNITQAQVQADANLMHMFLWCCKKCIQCAINSTLAFDGVADPTENTRPRVTNIHGTATAQFSNILVLVCAYKSWLSPLVSKEILERLMKRTILLHQGLRPLSPVFDRNYQVLKEAEKQLLPFNSQIKAQLTHTTWHSPASMHSQSSMASPATNQGHYSTPGPTSQHSSFGH